MRNLEGRVAAAQSLDQRRQPVITGVAVRADAQLARDVARQL